MAAVRLPVGPGRIFLCLLVEVLVFGIGRLYILLQLFKFHFFHFVCISLCFSALQFFFPHDGFTTPFHPS